MNSFKRAAFNFAGFVSLILGVVGIVLPLLPTTPFLLLSAACFARSSDKFYHWLLSHPWFGHYIDNYRQGRGIPLKVKVVAIAIMWLSISCSIIFFVNFIWAKLLLLCIAIAVSCYLWRQPDA